MVVVRVVVGSAWRRERRGANEGNHFMGRRTRSKPGAILLRVQTFHNGQAFLMLLETLFGPNCPSIAVFIPVTVSITHPVVE